MGQKVILVVDDIEDSIWEISPDGEWPQLDLGERTRPTPTLTSTKSSWWESRKAPQASISWRKPFPPPGRR